MLYADTVASDPLVHKPRVIVTMTVVATLFFILVNLTDTIFGEFMRPVIGVPAKPVSMVSLPRVWWWRSFLS